MPERTVTVGSKVGLHARPAALVAKAAAKAPVKISIRKGEGNPVAAASVLSLMTLGAHFGDEVVLSADGDGADAALAEIAEMIAKDLDA
jgi:phosphocarrier protein